MTANYVEDDNAVFRFDYAPRFLQWALKAPGWQKQWHLGVRVAKTKTLVGFISGLPATIEVNSVTIATAEINFLCVHKKLREKRLAPVLIREITRLVQLNGIFQAVYTAGVLLPTPMAAAHYYHRSLNPRKLLEVGFTHLRTGMTIETTIQNYLLPSVPPI